MTLPDYQGGSIVNLTTLGTRRGTVSISVAYGTDVAAAMNVMQSAAQRADLVLDSPGPGVAFVGFGASSLDFEVRPWAKSSDWAAMLHNVRITLYDDLNAAGIDIPFDQIVVHQG